MLGCAELLIQLQHRRTVSVRTTSTVTVEVCCVGWKSSASLLQIKEDGGSFFFVCWPS